jgi:hypothetical protein
MKRSIRYLSKLSTFGVVALSPFAAATALADTSQCTTPTVDQCRDATYLESDCGLLQRQTANSVCSGVFRDKYTNDTAGQTTQSVMGPRSPDERIDAYVPPYSFTHHATRGLDAQYTGPSTRSELSTLVANLTDLGDATTRARIAQIRGQRNAWQANANGVASCAEYAYEKFYDLNQFKDAADPNALDDRKVIDLAFAAGAPGIANRALYSRSRASVTPDIPFPKGAPGSSSTQDLRVPKNGYFAAYRALLDGNFFHANETALRLNMLRGFHAYTMTWNQLATLRTALANYHDDEIRYWSNRQREFASNVDRRAAIYADIVAGNTARQSELDGVDATIRQMLTDAQADGCLDSSATPTKCDMSSTWARDLVESFIGKLTGDTYQRCLDATADNFTRMKDVKTNICPAFPANGASNDYTTSTEAVDAFIDQVTNKAPCAKDLITDPKTGKKALGQQKSDEGRIGSASFGVDWSYDVGWLVSDMVVGSECNASSDVHGDFKATGSAFGYSQELVAGHVAVDSTTAGLSMEQYFRVLGKDVWDPSQSTNAATPSWSFVKTWGQKLDPLHYGTTVYALGIPLHFEAGFSGAVNASLSANAAALSNRCAAQTGDVTLAELHGNVKPSIDVEAYASGGIGWDWASAGVRADLTLAKGDVTVQGDAYLKAHPSTGKIGAQGTMTAKEQLRFLDGKVEAYIEAGWGLLDESVTLFKWDGPRLDDTLIDANGSVEYDVGEIAREVAASGGT